MDNVSNNETSVLKTIKLYIGGEFVRTESGRSFPSYDANKKLHAHLCKASRKDVRKSVEWAQKSTHSWASRSAYNRGQILYRMAEMAQSKQKEFMDIHLQWGCTKEEARASVNSIIDSFVYYGGFADKFSQLMGGVNPVSGPFHNFTTPEPMGVVGLLMSDKSSPKDQAQVWVARLCALLCSGNTVLALLPPSIASLIAPLSEVFATSDLPRGTVNVLTGSVEELAPVMGEHMEIQALCICGNPKSFSHLHTMGVHNMKRVVEVKSPLLSLESILSFVEYKTVWHPIGM